MPRWFYLIGIVVLWAAVGLGVEQNTIPSGDQAETIGHSDAPSATASEWEGNPSEKITQPDKETTKIGSGAVEDKEGVTLVLQHRLTRTEKRISDLEKILGPLQSNITIFFAALSALLGVLTVLVGLWGKVLFERKTRFLSTDVQKKIEDAVSKIDKEARTHMEDEINDITEYHNALMHDFIATALESLTRKDAKGILCLKDVWSATIHTGLNRPINVRNSCLNLKRFHELGYWQTALARTSLYRALAKWSNKAKKAESEERKKEALEVAKELEETIKILKGPSGSRSADTNKENS